MFKKIRGILKKCVIPLCLCSILIAAGVIWHWFYVLAAGVILAVSTFVYIVTAIVKKEDGESIGTGCLLTVIFVVLVCFYHDNRFIIQEDDKQHIYSDCRTIKRLQSKRVPAFGWSDGVLSESVIEVTELEGFFHLAFTDCPECKYRKEREMEEQKRELLNMIQRYEQEKRQELKEHLQGLIDRLDSGEDAEDIERQLEKDWHVEPEDGYVFGVPSRYQ